MQEKLVSFKTAKLAKNKMFGFDCTSTDYVDGFYSINGVSYEDIMMQGEDACRDDFYIRPTQSLLQRWIRDIHGIHIIIIPTVTSSWTYKIVSVISQRDDDIIRGIKSVSDLPPYKEVCGYDFNTFEDALEDALFESLKLV